MLLRYGTPMAEISVSATPMVGRIVQVGPTRPGAGELGRIATVPVELPFGRGRALYYRILVESETPIPGAPVSREELDPTRIGFDPTALRDPSDPRQRSRDLLPARGGEAGTLAPETASELFRLRLEEALDPAPSTDPTDATTAASGTTPVSQVFDRLIASARSLFGFASDTAGVSTPPARGALVDQRV